MATLKSIRRMSVEAYLEAEERADEKHEFVDGEMRAMGGASPAHNLICGAMYVALRGHLQGTGCRPYIVDVKLRIGSNFYYPDLIVECRPRDVEDRFVVEPALVIEVLSPSTAEWDRKHKFTAYTKIPTLREYVLVAQSRREVRVHRRGEAGWVTDIANGKGSLRLASVDLDIPLDAIYADVLP